MVHFLFQTGICGLLYMYNLLRNVLILNKTILIMLHVTTENNKKITLSLYIISDQERRVANAQYCFIKSSFTWDDGKVIKPSI